MEMDGGKHITLPHEEIADEGVDRMSGSLIPNSLVAPQPHPLASHPQTSETSLEG